MHLAMVGGSGAGIFATTAMRFVVYLTIGYMVAPWHRQVGQRYDA